MTRNRSCGLYRVRCLYRSRGLWIPGSNNDFIGGIEEFKRKQRTVKIEGIDRLVLNLSKNLQLYTLYNFFFVFNYITIIQVPEND